MEEEGSTAHGSMKQEEGRREGKRQGEIRTRVERGTEKMGAAGEDRSGTDRVQVCNPIMLSNMKPSVD